jgi:hypothetical protein
MLFLFRHFLGGLLLLPSYLSKMLANLPFADTLSAKGLRWQNFGHKKGAAKRRALSTFGPLFFELS